MANALIGGDKLKKKLDDMVKNLGIERSVSVGFHENSKCGWDMDASAPQIAFIQEFGAPAAHIPPRPFMRTFVQIDSARWGKILGVAVKEKNYNSEQAMGLLGLAMGEKLQYIIAKWFSPQNAPATAIAKGFDDPLKESRNMLRAVGYEVDKLGRKTVNEEA